MREITDHHDGHGLAESLKVTADPTDLNAGGASHYYEIMLNGAAVGFLQFQHGPRHESSSVPGTLDGVLLAIVVDRMRCFNAGPFATRENALVMTHCQEALHWLKHRADERAARDVLGRNVK